MRFSERKIFKVCLAIFQNWKESLIYYPQLSESWYFQIRFIKQLILYLITNVWHVACNFTFILRNLLTRTKSLREKCPNTQFFSVFSWIRTEYGDLFCKSPFSVRLEENTDQKKLRIWTFFTQLISISFNVMFSGGISLHYI